MRTLATLLFLSSAWASIAQVEVDVPIRFTGVDGQRGIDGISSPTASNAAITVEVASSGQVHWALATVDGDTLTLFTTPPVASYRNGLLLRFAAVGTDLIKPWVRTPGSTAYPLIRHDGEQVLNDVLRPNSIAEVLFNNDAWILLNSSYATCPVGSVAVNERLCMETTAFPGLRIHAAINRCGDRGGRLCTWDEYVAGCTLQSDQLLGLYDEWEWIDDTSNHTHTADQAGRFTCQSQRTANAITLIVGDTRCCYHPR